ncbi:MAG: ribbon-helix-helix domain-containing protein [Acidobacteriaceae bacterium]
MPDNATRWSLVVSTATDRALRQFLAGQGGGRKGDLSRFVEEAVQAHILDLSVRQAKTQNAGQDEDAIRDAVEEALQWARRR